MILYQSKNQDFVIRSTEKMDAALILSFIHKLAIYEKCEDVMRATVKDLEVSLFELKQAEVIIAEYQHIPIGFALFFHNYSTFLGKGNLYLEDLYIDEAYRGKGFGKIIFKYLAQLALNRGCERMDWMCLDWNKPSRNFYESLGAKPLSDWITYRLDYHAINRLAKE